jgi:hypothetical protein
MVRVMIFLFVCIFYLPLKVNKSCCIHPPEPYWLGGGGSSAKFDYVGGLAEGQFMKAL